MAMSNTPRHSSPAPRAPASDFSAGSSSAPSPRPPRAPRVLRAFGWLLVVLVALLLTACALLWWWAGSGTSLATTLARAQQYLPAGQQLESREVTGSLRSGGRIGWLRWSSPSLSVEVTDLRLGWQLAPLLQRRLALGEVLATRVQITPLASAQSAEPPTPPNQLVLPLHIGVPFRVDQLQWAGAPAVEAWGLAGDYHFDGREHRLNIGNVELAQGQYNARLTLQAQAPLALNATVDGTVRTAVPGGNSAIQLGAHATLQGTLATAAAQLQLQASIQPTTTQESQATPPPPATADAMQAKVQATLAPWSAQPLQSAQATLRAVNLAALWPQAPATQLHGTVQAGPTQGTASSNKGWAMRAQLRNELAGPWDQTRLPLTALQADANYDGTRWTVPGATVNAGTSALTLHGSYTPATGALDGQAELRNLRPDALHTAWAAAPLAGRMAAQMQGEVVRFTADIQAISPTAAPPSKTPANRSPLLRINTFAARGSWHPPSPTQPGGTLHLERLLLDALQARVEATQLRVAPGEQSGQGLVTLAVPGATARAQGSIAAQTGGGDLQMQWTDVGQTQRWLASLPLVGTPLQQALHGATAQGTAQLTARWKGGWQTLARQLELATANLSSPDTRRTGSTPPSDKTSFELQAALSAPQLDLSLPAGKGGGGATAVQLRAVNADLSGTLSQATLALDGEARLNASRPPQMQRLALQTRAVGGLGTSTQGVQMQISALRLVAQDAAHPGPWALQLAEPLSITARATPGPGASAAAGYTLQASAGQARLTGPLPGTATLRWQPLRMATSANPLQLQTQGTLQGLPMAWVDALGLADTPAAAGRPSQPLLARMGLATSIMLDGHWNVDTTQGPRRASASLRRASGDLHILAGDANAITAVQSSGQGTGAGAATVIATEASASPAGSANAAGTAAGVRQAELSLEIDGDALRTQLAWASERAGEVQASASTRLTPGAPPGSGLAWAPDAPLAGTLRARLPDVGVWSAVAPPGWRVRGTLDASATLSGTRNAPRWAGTLGADDMAVRSVLDGVDLQGGRLRATLQGNQLQITEFRLQGGRGSGARIAGFSGNRTAAPQDGGTLTASGRVSWGDSAAASTGLSDIAMSLQAEAKALQVLVRADRQVSVSGQLQAQLQQGQISLRGKLTTDRATIILPDESAPSLGTDVVVRSAAKDREDQTRAQAAAKTSQIAAQAETAKPPDIAITLNLGRDFALSGHGITTRLTGEVELRSSAVPKAPPRVTGEVRAEEGRYRAWGQMLDVETGLIRFNGPYNNPSLDILALRPNISVRAGVQLTGSAQAPRVKLYSDPELPDAEKLSWVVLGRSASAGGAEAAVLQQAALALLGSNGGPTPAAKAASRLGLDEIGFRGASAGEDASAAALTFGKRLSKDLYVTYERSLSGTLGTLYIFYDISRRLTLRGQTGEKSAVDIIYTVKYD
ncbi:MAG: translocation/assembly module TamB domain-containing protein [Acidovorax sp.]|uniref:translocation/assembly module TamB domain-containing protein n=1 Tax=Acidovorax sp. TaxID=1872122 RepID=UPI0026286FAE|nr:translocation/assembly module TamB domain-containing protein [Acidovorax sp.]MDH4416376.1 translocation/assembly module TamB domain-containing protein [Acidovorax sp.]